jgi:hypothetical protein
LRAPRNTSRELARLTPRYILQTAQPHLLIIEAAPARLCSAKRILVNPYPVVIIIPSSRSIQSPRFCQWKDS